MSRHQPGAQFEKNKRVSLDEPPILVHSPRHNQSTPRSRQQQQHINALSRGDNMPPAELNTSPISPNNQTVLHFGKHHVQDQNANTLRFRWTRRTTMGLINGLLVLLLHRFLSITSAKQIALFYLYYQPFAPFLIMLWLWGVNVWFFEVWSIRYELCFSPEEQKHLLPSYAIFDIANVLSTVVMSSGAIFLFYCIQGANEIAALQPPLIYSAMLVILLLPFTILYHDTRRFFATTAWRVITPIRSVTWADFLLADILTSLAKGISDVERAVCLMASGSVMQPASNVCDDASWVIPLGLALPYVWRLIQCMRVHADTGAKPQLWNALKYFTAFPVIILSAVKYHVTIEAWRGFYKPLWLLAALINSGFSFFWDVERDWEISFFSQMKSQKSLAVQPVLQSNLLYNRLFYLYLIISNGFLRLSWTYKLSPHLRRNHSAVFLIVLAEAFRRFQWIFVRIEVELRKIQSGRPELGQLVPASMSSNADYHPSKNENSHLPSEISGLSGGASKERHNAHSHKRPGYQDNGLL